MVRGTPSLPKCCPGSHFASVDGNVSVVDIQVELSECTGIALRALGIPQLAAAMDTVNTHTHTRAFYYVTIGIHTLGKHRNTKYPQSVKTL